MNSNIQYFINEQLPEFVRNDFSKFVDFIKLYYIWLNDQGVGSIEEVIDLDLSPAKFIPYYRNQYDRLGFSAKASLDGDSGYVFNTKYLKNMKEFYTSKGAEHTLIFMMKNIFQTDAIIRYPSENILRSSDGKWSQERAFVVETLYGDIPLIFTSVNLIVNTNTSEKIQISRSEIIGPTNVRFYTKTPINVSLDQHVEIIQDGVLVWIGKIVNNHAYIEIVNGGSNWQLGQVIIFPGSVKNTVIRVAGLSTNDSIKYVNIIELGWDHEEDQTVTVLPTFNSDISEQATLIFHSGIVATLIGKWKDSSGQISNQEIRLEDNFYYQQFSYDIETDISPSQYIDIVSLIHPAGTKLFTTCNLSEYISVSPEGITTYPFKTISLFDSISSNDIIRKTLSRYYSDTPNIIEDMTINLNKYNSITADSVTATAGSTKTELPAAEYALDYFAEIYSLTEKTVNLT